MDHDREFLSPAEKREARSAAGKSHKAFHKTFMAAFRASYDDRDADVFNLMEGAAREEPEITALRLFGLARRAIDELAEHTQSDPEAVAKRLLH